MKKQLAGFLQLHPLSNMFRAVIQARTGLSFLGAGTALFTAYHGHSRLEQQDIAPACGLLVANGSFLLLFATRRYTVV